jgi:probable HAF family extracellular repeat protein
LSGGSYTTLDDPAATLGTFASGINGSGQIVGQYQNASGLHGFLLSGGTYTTLDDPAATRGTNAFGINTAGQIVGYYTDNNGDHGFLFDPNRGVFPPASPSMIPWPTTSPLHEASTTWARSSDTISITPISLTASS